MTYQLQRHNNETTSWTQYCSTNNKTLSCNRGVDPYGTGPGTRPPNIWTGGHYHECPPQDFWSNISYFLSMQYFLDKLKEFSEFSQKKNFSTGCKLNILRIKCKKRQITFCQGLQGLCSTLAVRPYSAYTVPRREGVIVRGERMKVNERRRVVGGWLATVCPPNRGERSTPLPTMCTAALQAKRRAQPSYQPTDGWPHNVSNGPAYLKFSLVRSCLLYTSPSPRD